MASNVRPNHSSPQHKTLEVHTQDHGITIIKGHGKKFYAISAIILLAASTFIILNTLRLKNPDSTADILKKTTLENDTLGTAFITAVSSLAFLSGIVGMGKTGYSRSEKYIRAQVERQLRLKFTVGNDGMLYTKQGEITGLHESIIDEISKTIIIYETGKQTLLDGGAFYSVPKTSQPITRTAKDENEDMHTEPELDRPESTLPHSSEFDAEILEDMFEPEKNEEQLSEFAGLEGQHGLITKDSKGRYHIFSHKVEELGRGKDAVGVKIFNISSGIFEFMKIRKETNKIDKKEFKKETNIAKPLGRVITVFNITSANGKGFLAATGPLAKGGTAADWLSKKPNLTERLKGFGQALKDLSGLHDQGVIHKDAIPANIVIFGESRDRVFKFTDFGSSAEIPKRDDKVGLALFKSRITSSYNPTYNSSEDNLIQEALLQSYDYDKTVQFATKYDVFTMGVNLYQFIIGRDDVFPYSSEFGTGLTAAGEFDEHGELNEALKEIPIEVRPSFINLIKDMTNEDFEKRPSMEEALVRFQEIQQELQKSKRSASESNWVQE